MISLIKTQIRKLINWNNYVAEKAGWLGCLANTIVCVWVVKSITNDIRLAIPLFFALYVVSLDLSTREFKDTTIKF